MDFIIWYQYTIQWISTLFIFHFFIFYNSFIFLITFPLLIITCYSDHTNFSTTNSEEEAQIMLANSWLYQYYGYQNQPCGMVDPRCQKFFRRDQYQEYQEYYVENQEMDYSGYHVSSYVQKDEFGCERVYERAVDYSTHSPGSTISEERWETKI